MGLMSSKIEREKLMPGDHIYTWRSGYSYSHHGIYVGDGKVIHLTRGPGLVISSSSGSQPSDDDRVVCCNIEEFLCDGQLYCFEYAVDIAVFAIKRPGTCSIASSNPSEHVLHRASYLLEHGFGNYDLLQKNCEDFSIYCKTGLLRIHMNRCGISGQIKSLFAALFAISAFPYRFLPADLIVVALAVFGLYCTTRLASDVGSETNDCDVVPVEKLDQLSNTDNLRENTKILGMSTTPRWFLAHGRYVSYSSVAMKYWYCTPESKILVWFKSCIFYLFLTMFVDDHLEMHGFKLGVYSAYTIWLLGYLYWRRRSVSTILLWTRLLFLHCLLSSLVSHQRLHDPRSLKLQDYASNTTCLLGLWHWTPGSTILLWIKFGLVFGFSFRFVPNHPTNHIYKTGLNIWFIGLVCILCTQRVALLGLVYSDYIFRIRKKYYLSIGGGFI